MASERSGWFGKPTPTGEGLADLPAKPPRAPADGAPDPARQVRFAARPPRFRLEDVVLPDATARIVRSVLAKVEHHRTLYETWGFRKLEPAGERLAFNLYGAPGTGKTMLAEALAGKLGRQVIEVNYAEIESKYVGDTPKNITAAFDAAREARAALLFDEADSILGKRMTNVTQAADHSVNVSRAVMLKQLDSFEGVVMFATNLARNFDGAFVRRILFHIEVAVPDLDGRQRLWAQMVPLEAPGRSELSFAALAAESEGLAGGDIRNAVLMAATEAVQRSLHAKRLTMDDLRFAIAAVRHAKREVGDYDYAPARDTRVA